MADDKQQTPAPRNARERTPGKADADTASDKRVAGSAGDDKNAHVITGTGTREEERGGKKVMVLTDRPDNFANDADLGKEANDEDDDKKDDDK